MIYFQGIVRVTILTAKQTMVSTFQIPHHEKFPSKLPLQIKTPNKKVNFHPFPLKLPFFQNKARTPSNCFTLPISTTISHTQALTHVIPGIVNTFIGLFKDTTLVLIIGLFDLLGQAQSTIADAYWSSPAQAPTAYLAVAIMFFVFCFGMSRYSMFMERKLSRGHR